MTMASTQNQTALDSLRRNPYAVATGGAVLLLVAMTVARLSTVAFVAAGIGFLALLGYAALQWPRVILVIVALSAILDRYVVAGFLPASLGLITHLFSESLLGVVGLVLGWRAWQADRLVPAFRHPATAFLLLFLGAALISGVVNGVSLVQTAAGIAFTVDAVALFYLARLVGFNARQATAAISAFVGLMLVAAVVALLQAVLTPNLFGLHVLLGRFGEAYRLASIFGDPNVFAALISAAAPFLLIGVVHSARPRERWLNLAGFFLLALTLWLSFSRGGWLGMLIGLAIGTLILERRALFVGIAVIVVAFGTAAILPRDLLGRATGEQRPDLVGSTFERFGTVGTGRDLRTLFVLNAIQIVADHPVLGVGPGRFGGAAADLLGTPVYAQYGTDRLFTDPSQRTVDNFWLHLLVEFGVIGFLAFCFAILSIAVPIFRSAMRAFGRRRVVLIATAIATITILANSVSTMLLEANSVAFVFWFLLGVGSLLAASGAEETIAGGTALGAERVGPEATRTASPSRSAIACGR
jgi:putative inorganic carbon (HCO3(-)) transporter